MHLELTLALILFSFTSSITPGPNNLMLLASGVNFGFRASLPHMLGISLGHMVMVCAVGLGLGAIFKQIPILHDILKWGGAAYLLYLAYKIATAAPLDENAGNANAAPFTFFQAAGFQWINPKAWIMAITPFTTYSPADYGYGWAAWVGVVFACVNFPSIGVWVGFGVSMRRWLSSPAKRRVFNRVMAGLLVLSIIPMLRV